MLSKEEVDVLYDGDNYYKYFNTLDVGIDLQKYTQARLIVSSSTEDPVIGLKGIFTNFLFSITVDRADGLAMLSGQMKFFPIGSAFTYGIAEPKPDDGKMVFIKKPRFVKKYVPSGTMLRLGDNPAAMRLSDAVEITDPVSSVDVESVLVSKSLLSFAAIAEASSSRLVAGRINPFRNRVIFYSHTESPQLLPLKLYLSRCLYYGFFANSRFKFV